MASVSPNPPNGSLRVVAENLDRYREKRDFGLTPEPPPMLAGAYGGPPRFVIQRHDARALHFDLRLEFEGALASWAVPKGLPLREDVKRLAVRTEPHPLEYLTFAAEIPSGQYGAGLMTIWDHGTYEPILVGGDEWKVHLRGNVLDGEYHLVKTAGRGGRDEWLVFRSKKGPPGTPDPGDAYRALRPMLAEEQPVDSPRLDDPAYAVEIKWDGFRGLAYISGGGTELRSREGNDLTARFKEVSDLRRYVLCAECILDGEIVSLDAEGRADFGRLQSGTGDIRYAVFDLLYVDGEWLTERPWEERAARLEAVLSPVVGSPILRSDWTSGNGRALFQAVSERGVEGVVVKRRSAPYLPGQRSGDWIKVKARQVVEVIVGGFLPGEGARRGTFGALLVGIADEGGLIYAGRVGGGFADRDLAALAKDLAATQTESSPFVEAPDERGARWVTPEIRGTVRFTEWTRDRRLRNPVWLGRASAVTLGAPRARELVLADGPRNIKLTNLDKVFWPRLGITKGDLIDHYLRVAEVLVPHLAGRPLIMKRFPNGIDGEFFFQHNLPDTAPEWLHRRTLSRSDKPDAEPVVYGLVDDPLALAWMANLGCIDLNPWQSLADAPDVPTSLVIDLDPPDGTPFPRVVEVAQATRRVLGSVGLRGYPKTSGSRGLHIYVPVVASLPNDVVQAAAVAIATQVARELPTIATVERMKANRGGRIYVDPLQNGHGKSLASVYSVRPVPAASVSTPLDWDEVDATLDPKVLTIAEIARRIAEHGDLFRPVLDAPQDLAQVVGALT